STSPEQCRKIVVREIRSLLGLVHLERVLRDTEHPCERALSDSSFGDPLEVRLLEPGRETALACLRHTTRDRVPDLRALPVPSQQLLRGPGQDLLDRRRRLERERVQPATQSIRRGPPFPDQLGDGG